MTEVPISEFQKAIRNRHGCESRYVDSLDVTERFPGHNRPVSVSVAVFELIGHQKASRCYAWAHPAAGSGLPPVLTLHEGEVYSPQSAVRAAAQDWQRGGGPSTPDD
jgi:hypothetical protein